MKMEQIQNAQTILSGNGAVELTDTDLAKVQGGCSNSYNSQCYCQDDWGDGNSSYKNSFNNDNNNNNNNNTNLNLLNGLSLL